MTDAIHFEAKFYMLRKNKDGIVVGFVVHPSDVPDDLVRADVGQQYIVALAPYQGGSATASHERIEANSGQAPALSAAGQKQRDLTEGERARRRSVLMCKDYRFHMWLSAHSLYKKGQLAEEFIRERCGVKSRGEFATDANALQRFLAFETKYLSDTGQLAERRG